jgi:indole-3-glycerol phosphate synthase
MADILENISRVRREQLAQDMTKKPLEILVERACLMSRPIDFLNTFSGPDPKIIAEVKKASPSKGILRPDLNPAGLAGEYEAGGAAAVSVLTEESYFLGSVADLEKVRKKVSLPILRKDFIIDPYQVIETRAAGADSFLLIAGLLDAAELKQFIRLGREWGMEPLVEVHDPRQLRCALEAGARIIGINNRNLETFSVDVDVSVRLVKSIPKDRIVISESGIRNHDDILRLVDSGVRGFLVGESLVTSPDPAAKIRELLNGF